MAQEHLPRLPGRVHGGQAQDRWAPELGVGVGARLAAGRQELRDGRVRAAQQPGRRVVAPTSVNKISASSPRFLDRMLTQPAPDPSRAS
jgi:hypothetical protein